MKINALKKRLNPQRSMSSVTIRMPEDLIEDMKRIAQVMGFSGYQPLMRSYIGAGIRTDLEKIENDPMAKFMDALRHQGVSEESIQKAIEEFAA